MPEKCKKAKGATLVLPEPVAWMLGCQTMGGDVGWNLSWYKSGAGVCHRLSGKEFEHPLFTEQQMRALLATATGLPAQAVPDGWREQFAAEVYADLAAADNQDVPLEEYPARILKVLDAIVGPRHPTVVQWRNDAINACIAIAYKYCRDPESHKYLKQDLEAMLTAEPAPQAQADARDAERYRWLRNPNQDVSLVLDKQTGYVPISEDGRTGGYGIYEYRAGCELDAAIDAAIAAAKGGVSYDASNPSEAAQHTQHEK